MKSDLIGVGKWCRSNNLELASSPIMLYITHVSNNNDTNNNKYNGNSNNNINMNNKNGSKKW